MSTNTYLKRVLQYSGLSTVWTLLALSLLYHSAAFGLPDWMDNFGCKWGCIWKQLLTIVLITVSLTIPSFGAFGAATAWDIRTTGSDSNGGGFDSGVASPGTDYSQQDAAQVAYTDIVIGGTTTQATSVANPFGATSPGNIINITAGAGCTVQRAEIVSVSGTTATFDKSLGTAASTCTGNFGGALATYQAAFGLAVDNNIMWLKSGTYTYTANIVTGALGSFQFIGFATTHGDNGTRPLITTSSTGPNVPPFFLQGSGNAQFINLSFSDTGSTRSSGIENNSSTQDAIVANCILDGYRIAVDGFNGTGFRTLIVQGTEVKNGKQEGIYNNGNLTVVDSYVHDNNATGGLGGIVGGGKSMTIMRAISSANAQRGAYHSVNATQVTIISSVFANNSTAGLQLAPASNTGFGVVVEDSVFYGNTTYGFIVPAGLEIALNQNNAYGANGTANRSGVAAGLNDVTLSANPFVSSTNFALNSTAGGGAALKQLGYPGIFPGATSTGYLDIGAVQTSGAPGTGGAFNGAFVQ
jgi:hypothetical protein